MVVSGTHSLDMCMWLLEGRTPVEVYARSTDRTSGRIGTKDGTSGIFTMDDGMVFSMNINWALPTVWPGAVYGLEIGIVGTDGVIDIEDTHRDVILASEIGQPAGYTAAGSRPPAAAARRLHRQLSARRPLGRAAVGADARGDHVVVQPGVPRRRHTARHRGRRPRATC